MYKLMIVDDEKIMCDALTKLIDWEDMGVSVIGTFQNGMDAYRKVKEDCPDILVTDIQMPGMNGIDLIGKIRSEGLHIKFILLSAYGEFEYAREAMKYGVKHYLLKPCNEEQIIEAVSELCGELVRQKGTKVLSGKIYSEVTENVIDIVECELSNPELNLKWIAEKYLYMNVDYVGRKFLTDTGQKFTAYLKAVRIQKARELLISEECVDIYSVANKIGYGNNPQYFRQTFKNVTGFSPTEYIKRFRHFDEENRISNQ